MKKTYALISILSVLVSAAQTSVYHPFPTDSALWNDNFQHVETFGTLQAVANDLRTIKLGGDTTINLVQYHKLIANGHTFHNYNGAITNSYTNLYSGALRQDIAQKKVFYFPPNDSMEYLLYNFTLNAGDTLDENQYNNFGSVDTKIHSIDSVFVGTTFRKRFLLVPGDTSTFSPPDTTFAIIEGIGGTVGLFNQLKPPFEDSNYLLCFTDYSITYPNDYGNCNYTVGINEHKQKLASVFPNPASSYFQITLSEELEKGNITITNQLGEEISKQQFQGMQIQVNTEEIPAGIYFIIITNNAKIISRNKIIINHSE
jgi:hypothetical protein